MTDKALQLLAEEIPDPSEGLGEDAFLLVSRLTPIVNVDLLIKDEKGRTLLSWRDDSYAAKGWHVPGGIVRFKEKLETRVRKVAELEIGAAVEFCPVPLAINQIIDDDLTCRGHFISVLYKCFLPGEFVPKNAGLSTGDPGYLMWHDKCPANLIKHHEIYKSYLLASM
jgi:colanic acid biosynthesis protein WcaH